PSHGGGRLPVLFRLQRRALSLIVTTTIQAPPTEIRGGLEYPKTYGGHDLWREDPFVRPEGAGHCNDVIRVFNRANGSHYYLERADNVQVGDEVVVFRIASPSIALPEAGSTHGTFLRRAHEEEP